MAGWSYMTTSTDRGRPRDGLHARLARRHVLPHQHPPQPGTARTPTHLNFITLSVAEGGRRRRGMPCSEGGADGGGGGVHVPWWWVGAGRLRLLYRGAPEAAILLHPVVRRASPPSPTTHPIYPHPHTHIHPPPPHSTPGLDPVRVCCLLCPLSLGEFTPLAGTWEVEFADPHCVQVRRRPSTHLLTHTSLPPATQRLKSYPSTPPTPDASPLPSSLCVCGGASDRDGGRPGVPPEAVPRAQRRAPGQRPLLPPRDPHGALPVSATTPPQPPTSSPQLTALPFSRLCLL